MVRAGRVLLLQEDLKKIVNLDLPGVQLRYPNNDIRSIFLNNVKKKKVNLKILRT